MQINSLASWRMNTILYIDDNLLRKGVIKNLVILFYKPKLNLMKKMNFKNVLTFMAIILTIVFFEVNANAQSIAQTNVSELPFGGKGIYSLPTQHFVPTANAIQLLNQSITDLKAQAYSPSGSLTLQNLVENQIRYYRGIIDNLERGKEVNTAIVWAMTLFYTDNATTMSIDSQQLVTFKQAAINLLKV
jgi:hypothetical protein